MAYVRYFGHDARRLSAEQMLDVVGDVLALPEKFPSVPSATRATQLPAPELADSSFLKVFGQPQRESVCACERTDESSLPQTLELYNGATIHAKLADPRNRFHAALARGEAPASVVAELYLSALSRPPTDREEKVALWHTSPRAPTRAGPSRTSAGRSSIRPSSCFSTERELGVAVSQPCTSMATLV